MSGASRRDSLRRLANSVRAIPGRDFGLYTYRVYVRTSTRDGAYALEGTETASETEILNAGQAVRVRQVSDEQMALTGIGKGSLTVGPITPSHSSGGMTVASLTDPGLAQQLRFRVVGPDLPDGAYYALAAYVADHALHYTLTLTPEGAVPA